MLTTVSLVSFKVVVTSKENIPVLDEDEDKDVEVSVHVLEDVVGEIAV